MPELRFLQHSGTVIHIESDASGGDAAIPIAPKFARAVQEVSELVVGAINDIDDERRPNQLNISFGLSVSSDGNILITLGEESANFRVNLQWASSELSNNILPFQE